MFQTFASYIVTVRRLCTLSFEVFSWKMLRCVTLMPKPRAVRAGDKSRSHLPTTRGDNELSAVFVTQLEGRGEIKLRYVLDATSHKHSAMSKNSRAAGQSIANVPVLTSSTLCVHKDNARAKQQQQQQHHHHHHQQQQQQHHQQQQQQQKQTKNIHY